MTDRNWFRQKEWNDQSKSLFFDKLSRARTQRDQYLAIQIGMLIDRETDAAIELSEYYFETRRNKYHDNHVLHSIAQAWWRKGEIENSLETLREAFEHEVGNPDHLTEASVELPFLIACLERKVDYPVALDALNFAEEVDLLLFPGTRFKWYAAHALIADDKCRGEASCVHASQAMEEYHKSDSGFPYHQNTGLVRDVEPRVLDRLRKLSRS